MDSYHPISCALHSKYEVAILQRKAIDIKWQDTDSGEQEIRHKTLLPYDLLVKDGEEFLLAQDKQGNEFQIRLDLIQP